MSRTLNIPSAITKIEELLAKVREAVSGETTKASKKSQRVEDDDFVKTKKRGSKPKSAKKQKVKEEKVRVNRGEKQKPVRVTPDGNKKVVKHSRLRAVKRVKNDEVIEKPKKAKKLNKKKLARK